MLANRGNKKASVVIVGDLPSYPEVVSGMSFTDELWNMLVSIITNNTSLQESELCGVSICDKLFSSEDKKKLKHSDYYDLGEPLRNFLQYNNPSLIIALGNSTAQALGVLKGASMPQKQKGRVVSSEELFGAKVLCTTHQYILQKEPENVDDFVQHLNTALREVNGNYESQAPIHIVNITSVDMLNHIVKYDMVDGIEVGYDFEATDKNPDIAIPSTLTLAPDAMTEDGKRICLFLPLMDKLVPCWTDKDYESIKEILTRLFMKGRKDVNFIAYNSTYDDWLAERWLKAKLPGSTHDVMWMQWVVNNTPPNDLKSTVSKYLGYVGYDDAVDVAVSEIASRRGKLLSHADDFKVLKYLGVDAEETKTGFKWPKDLDKKVCAYAMLELQDVRLYNSYDSVYTLELKKHLQPIIDDNGLSLSNHLRHRIGRHCMRAEQKGLPLDVDYNRKASKTLEQLSANCIVEIHKALGNDTFNVNSRTDLTDYLFGKPVELPHIDPRSLRGYNRKTVEDVLTRFHRDFYGNYSTVTNLLDTKELSLSALENELLSSFSSNVGISARAESRKVYPYGKYQPTLFTKTGLPAVGKIALQALYAIEPDPVLSLILMERKASKLKSTFIEGVHNKIDANNYLHGRLNVIGTQSGRLSSSGPNLQNLPAYLRGQFKAPEGYVFVNFDLKAAEVYTIATLCGDKNLLEAITKGDIHKATASKIYNKPEEEVTKEERRRAKTILFGLIYGMRELRLSIALGITIEEATEMIEQFFITFPDLKKWLDEVTAKASKPPYYTYTPFGTRRSTLNILSHDKGVVKHVQNIACNHPVQGGAGELVLWQISDMCDEIDEVYPDQIFLVNSTHDSGSFLTPIELVPWMEEVIVRCVQRTAPVSPLDQITFQADIDHDVYWYGEPDVYAAVDPAKAEGKDTIFLWELVAPERTLDREDLIEFLEIEAHYEQSRTT